MTRGQRTYWHLGGQQRWPTHYELVSTNMLYQTGRGYEVDTPGADWVARHRGASPLRATFAAFADPRETTYRSYVDLQRDQEAFVDELFSSMADSDDQAGLDGSWQRTLEAVVPVLRFPVHGLQMLSAYVGHLAPEGRVVCACAFQTGDEMRRIQRLAYRTHLLSRRRPDLDAASRRDWATLREWQLLRELVERLLTTYDFGEALVATNLVFKPAFDELFLGAFAARAREAGDRLWCEVLRSLGRDARWHNDWAVAALRCALAEEPDNRAVVETWVERWWSLVVLAVSEAGRGLSPERADGWARASVERRLQLVWSRVRAAARGAGRDG